MNAHTPYLTEEQVFALNEKHGWFEFGDAQSDVSKAFAQDAIATYELVRDAAPELLAVAKKIKAHGTLSASWIEELDAAISKATRVSA